MTDPSSAVPTVNLANGVAMPAIGFGTWELRGEAAGRATAAALEAGYRHIDTASMYANESDVGTAVANAIDAGWLNRDDLFITTKIWNDDHGFEASARSLDASRAKLGVEVIDLALIHWPGGADRLDTWRRLETQLAEGTLAAIGVSNYSIDDLDELAAASAVTPMVNQIEFNPFLHDEQLPLVERCRRDGIVVTAWRPLTKGRALDHPTINAVADEVGRTPAQVLLRWAMQHGVVPLPKTSSPARMAENLAVFDFKLDSNHMDALNNINSTA